MNEVERLAYLDAMGIDQWVPVAPLPNAKPSEFEALSEFSSSATEDAVPQESGQKQAHPLQSQTQSPVQTSTSTPAPAPEPVPVPVEKHQQLDAKEQRKISKEREESALKTVEAKDSVAAMQELESARFALGQCVRQGQYLFLVELENDEGKISKEEQVLLNNICLAVDKALGLNAYSNVNRQLELFKWPLFNAQSQGRHLDQGWQSAMQAAKAFINGSLERNDVGLVLCLGRIPSALLASENKTLDKDFEVSQGLKLSHLEAGQSVAFSNSLKEMNQNKLLKAQLWQSVLTYTESLKS